MLVGGVCGDKWRYESQASGLGGVKWEGKLFLKLSSLPSGKFCKVPHLHIYHQARKTIVKLFLEGQ